MQVSKTIANLSCKRKSIIRAKLSACYLSEPSFSDLNFLKRINMLAVRKNVCASVFAPSAYVPAGLLVHAFRLDYYLEAYFCSSAGGGAFRRMQYFISQQLSLNASLALIG